MSSPTSKTTALRHALDAANRAALEWDFTQLDRIMGGIKTALKQEIHDERVA